eukprot:scaffold5814_cov123-Isochrysis_galbana.AAC.10
MRGWGEWRVGLSCLVRVGVGGYTAYSSGGHPPTEQGESEILTTPTPSTVKYRLPDHTLPYAPCEYGVSTLGRMYVRYGVHRTVPCSTPYGTYSARS